MSEPIVDQHGNEWVTAELAREYVHQRLNNPLLRQWKRRKLVEAAQRDGVNWYRLDQLQDVELRTRPHSVRPAGEALANTITGALQ